MHKQFNEVKELYIEQNLSVSEISFKLGVSKRNIYYWVKNFNWNAEKEKYQKELEIQKKKLSKDMIVLADKLANKISKDIDEGRPLSQNDTFLFMNLLKLSPEARKYENLIKKENEVTFKKKDNFISKDLMRQIERDFLGIEYADDGD
ncbi:MAG: hypothetical protein R3Y28_02765 [Candidatus Gastranaerophilales bacterium]